MLKVMEIHCLVIHILLHVFICAFQKIAAVDVDFIKPYFLSDEQAQLIISQHKEVTRNESLPSELDAKTLCFCGLSTRTKILGGTETAINEFPWMTYIFITQTNGTSLCSGFLVTNLHVITAAHCVESAKPDDLIVFLGDHNITDPNETDSIRVKVSRVIIHPEFNKPNRHNNDIAILTFKFWVRFTFNVQPICLPPFNLKYDGMKGIIAGWGRLSPTNITSASLMSVDVPIISQAKCQANYAPFSVKITPKMFCAGENNMDACQGDSGGPFMISVKGRYFAIGVVAFGVNCGTAEIPGAYTRVDKFTYFIFKNILGGKMCF